MTVIKMSFSKETKSEMCRAGVSADSCRHSLVYGMVLFSRVFSPSAVSLTTESSSVATLYSSMLSSLTSVIVDTSVALTRRGSDRSLYNISVPDTGDCEKIFDFFGHEKKALNLRLNRSNIEDESDLSYFIRGAFLVCGNVTDPEKDYHLEYVVPFKNLAGDLSRIISETGIISAQPRIVMRKGSYVVYIKGSDSIADMLTYMGAPMASLEVVQKKIYRSVRNKVNRKINSETANLKKTADAAAKQLRAIEVIRKKRGLGYLSDELRELAELREENPEYNLRELGEALSVPISRSGVNHRLKRLIEIAGELKEEDKRINAEESQKEY